MKYFALIILLLALLSIGCKANKDLTDQKKDSMESNAEKPHLFPSRIIATIQPDYTIPEIEKAYAQYELQKFGKTSKTEHTYLFNFNDELISDVKLVKLLNKDKEHVISAKTLDRVMHDIKASKSGPKKSVKLEVK